MKKITLASGVLEHNYVAPALDVTTITVEKGFAASVDSPTFDPWDEEGGENLDFE